jgi:hypothetical protein
MNINNVSENILAGKMIKATAVSNRARPGEQKEKSGSIAKDVVNTSDLSRLISSNITILANESAARSDKISQFSAMLQSPVDTSSKTVLSIFRGMVSA